MEFLDKLLNIARLPAGMERRYGRAHRVWLAAALTVLGCCTGVLSLLFAATAYPKLTGWAILASYFMHPLILFLNLLPPVLLTWMFYFLSGRAWAGFLGGFLPTVGIALVNYFKIRLRSDPLLAVDLRLAAEAGGIVGGYTLDLTWLVWFAGACLVAGTAFAVCLMPRGVRDIRRRLAGAGACLVLSAAAFPLLFTNPGVYAKTENNRFINRWSDVEVFVSKGCVYPFLYSFRDMFPTPPEGYDPDQAAALLAQYGDSDIPEGKKASVLGVMLEAFCDLTDFDALARQEGVARVYAPWHELEEQSVSGDLLTNIFAGGTVDTEWAFLTGYASHDEFRSATDSYVWYLKGQGYQTFGSHPGYGWFYNRQNVNGYLGFDEYWFTENHYGGLVNPVAAVYQSDQLLADELFAQLSERIQAGPCFSFSVSYQNHGPYGSDRTAGEEYLTPDGSGLSAETCNIFNNYLHGVDMTIRAMTGLAGRLEELDEPVVLVLFGDHKPWAGNGNTGYQELGVSFDLSGVQGFRNYYAVPYLIWANSAARNTLGRDFVGNGGDFSPCFLMEEVFGLCAWEGPGFMKLSRQMRSITPMIHERGLFWAGGAPTDVLEGSARDFYQRFRYAQYYREHETVR